MNIAVLVLAASFLHPASGVFHPVPQEVVASWYGIECQGKPMACGERFNRHDPATVAHKSLPYGTEVVFRNPENGKSLTAVVKDRGPYVRGRDFDLSEAGAEVLGFKEDGVARLEMSIVASP